MCLTCWGKDIPEPSTGEPYEGGIVSEGSARARLSVRYYVVAMCSSSFLIWKLLFAWCVAARDLGWIGYGEVLISVGVLLAALVYLWKVGALDWSREPRGSR